MDAALAYGRGRLLPSRTAALDAQLLLGHVLGKGRAWLFGHGEIELSPQQQEWYEQLLFRRQAGEPVAYLRGHVEWFGMDLLVSPSVLVPRPETELLVEHALECLPDGETLHVVDLGTGSGAIALAIACRRPTVTVTAVEIDPSALQVAQQNLRRYGVDDRVRLVQGRLFDPVASPPDLVVANLPYLSAAMMEELDADVRHEPVTALLGGDTGLELYADMLRQLRDRGWSSPVLFEIDPRQAELAPRLVSSILPGIRAHVVKDYADLDRIVVVQP